MGKALLLPQSGVIDFVESPLKTLPFLKSVWVVRWGEDEGSGNQEEEREEELCKMKK